MAIRVASYTQAKNLNKQELSEMDKEILKISKLLAKSWINDEIGKKIKQRLLNEPDNITKLLGEAHNLTDGMIEDIDISKIFQCQTAKLNRNSFDLDVDLEAPERKYELIIGYPPQPSREALSEEELQDWINYEPEKHGEKEPPYYLPITF